MPNAVNRVGVAMIRPIDWLLSRIPAASAFAIRIGTVASKD